MYYRATGVDMETGLPPCKQWAVERGSARFTIKRKLRDEETYDALDNEEEEMQNYAVFGDPVPLPLDEDNTEEENDDENYYSSEE